MQASLKALLDYQHHKKEEYKSKVKTTGTLRDASYPVQMNMVLGVTTGWVAAAIKTQHGVATDPAVADNYLFKDSCSTTNVQYEDHDYLLEKDDLTCDSEFSQTMKLPCRHAMVYRKTSGNSLIIPFSSITSRYFQGMIRF